MIVGLDCSKKMTGKKLSREYTAVASYDTGCSKYYSTVDNDGGSTMICPVATLIHSCIKNYSIQRNEYPLYIFIYRSGVSDREKVLVKEIEVKSLINYFITENYIKDYFPKFCYILVNKTSDFKFFDGEIGKDLKNPSEGMIVDTDICNPDSYEFYLQPQYVNSGTATPTHFDVIYDSTKIPVEILESCTYYLCYYYWNWSGAIRIPAPLKYAEVCSKFSNVNLDVEVSDEKLKNSPYYI